MKKHSWFRGYSPARHMNFTCDSLWIAVTCGILLTAGGNAYAQGGPNFDVRATPGKATAAINTKIVNNPKADLVRKQLLEGKTELADRMPGLEVSVDETLGIASQISNGKGVLSEPASAKAEDTVKSFVANNYRLFGLGKSVESQVKTKASYENPDNKVKWVTLQQEIGGIPVFRSELKAALTEKGQLAAITNEIAPGLTEDVLRTPLALSPEDALLAAAKDLGVDANAKKLVRESSSDDGSTIHFKSVDNLSMLKVHQVIFPLAPGQAVLAWQVQIGFDNEGYIVVVEAATGETLFRKNLTNNQAQAATYLYYDGDSPAPSTPFTNPPNTNLDSPQLDGTPIPMSTKTLISEFTPANPLGWIPDYENTTRGNNVSAYRDQVAPNGIDQDETNPQLLSTAYGNSNGPSLFNRNFRFSISPAPEGLDGPSLDRSHSTYNNAIVTNMFFWSNRYHDYMYRLGFTEAAGNFQAQNFGRGGNGNDPVLAEALEFDLPYTNNATFMTPPDGTSGRMQMHVFEDMAFGWPLSNTTPARDSALDQHVLVHELAHGTSNRLVGNAFGLNNQQGGGMGEGWSDFFAISILSEYPAGKDQDPDKAYATGGWLTRSLGGVNYDSHFYGIRPFPYSTNRNYNPLTFADSDPLQYGTKDNPQVVPESPLCLSENGAQVHNLGHLWATILWEARARIMHGFETAGFASVAEAWKAGNVHMLQLVTDGMKLTPSSPTFIEARDAILRAALLQSSNPAGWVSSDSANPSIAAHDETRLWAGFAARGMGLKASAPPRFDTTSQPREPENYYTVKQFDGPASFPPPADANILKNLKDDDSRQVALPGQFTFYGQTYTSAFVGTNGYITFQEGDDSPEESLEHHFEQPRISGLLTDLDGSHTSGTISVRTQGGGAPSLIVTYRRVPQPGAEPGPGNSNSFEIQLGMDRFNPFTGTVTPGTVTVRFGRCTALTAICGLSPGPESPSGPFYEEGASPTVDEDLSALGPCNPELAGAYFTEVFSGPGETEEQDDLYDLEAITLNFTLGSEEGWTVSPVESFETPLQPREPKFTNQNGQESIRPGDFVHIRIPLENGLKKANLTGVLGLLTPISESVDVIDPVSDYGRVDAGVAVDGLDPFIIKVADNIPCGAQIQVKVDFTSDQGITGAQRNILLTVGGGFGDPQGSLSWPQGASSGVVAGAVDANATQFQLASQSNMRSGTNLKNSRTGEIVQVSSYNANTLAVTVKRGQKGTTKAAMQAGDNLSFDSVPIPDATSAGVGLTVFPTDPAIKGPIGRVKVKIGKLTHPNIGDLRISLSNTQGYSVLLMQGAKAGLGSSTVFSDITLDTSASLSIQNNNGIVSGGTYRPVQDFSAFQNINFDAGSTWTLTVADTVAPFAGDIAAWSIELTPYKYCDAPVVEASTIGIGATGWTSSTFGDPAQQNAYIKAATGTSPTSLVLHTKPGNSVRVPRWSSPGVEISKFPNQVYRFNAWIARSGQPQPGDQAQIPWMRMHAGVSYIMLNMRYFLFDTTKIDNSVNHLAMGMAPSTNLNTPKHYWVDFDPVDVPSLYENETHRVKGHVENMSFFPTHQGNFEVLETRMDRYSAPADSEATGVWQFSKLGVASTWTGNVANPVIESDAPYARPKVTTNSLGITLDSSRVQAVGSLSFATTEVDLGAQEVVMKPGHLYRVRFHVQSNTPASGNPILRLRARSINWADANELIIGPSNFGHEHEKQLGREALPGLGTKNPHRRGDEQQGGYYDQYVTAPPISSSNPENWKLRFGFDLLDYGYFGTGTPEQKAEGGRFTLDSIEVREFPQR